MPGWGDILQEIEGNFAHDVVRRKYLKQLADHTGRNVIAYYSGWLQFYDGELYISDNDKNGFMETIRGLDRTKGLDLLIHTPGGDIAATESIVEYLQEMFKGDIRVIVPQLAMSAGTMIACSAKVIIMGKQSSLGPTDPQIVIQTNAGPQQVAAQGLLEEFFTAMDECNRDPRKLPFWNIIISQYSPTLIGNCQKAIEWSCDLTRQWLLNSMFKDDMAASEIVDNIVISLSNHSDTKEHGRHLSASTCKGIGLKVQMMEEDQALQDAILAVHHAYIHTLSATNAIKIIENQEGHAFILSANKTP